MDLYLVDACYCFWKLVCEWLYRKQFKFCLKCLKLLFLCSSYFLALLFNQCQISLEVFFSNMVFKFDCSIDWKIYIFCLQIFQLLPFYLCFSYTIYYWSKWWFNYLLRNNSSIFHKPYIINHEHVSFIIISIKTWNCMLNKVIGSNDLILWCDFELLPQQFSSSSLSLSLSCFIGMLINISLDSKW